MAGIKNLAARFHKLFAGLECVHGTYNNISVEPSREDGKHEGKAYSLRQPVTDALWEAHLSGENGIGIVPFREDGTSMFGAIDIDVYVDISHVALVKQVKKAGFPFIVCRTKSGGAHLYLFCKEPVPAARMKERLRDIAALLGHGKAEVFPKQTSFDPDSKSLPNWINMPYFAYEATTRFALNDKGDACSAEEFLALAESQKAATSFFDVKADKKEKTLGQTHLPDGPPCLQHLMDLGFPPGSWNVGVFNLGIYCRKARPSDWREHLVQLNTVNFPPEKFPVSDLKDVIRSLEKKDYQYMCSTAPLVQYCNNIQCRQRKYGISGTESGFPQLGILSKLLTIPPVFFLEVEDRKSGEMVQIELSAAELRSPRAFAEKCIQVLDRCPIMPGDAVWAKTIDLLLSKVQWLDPPPEDSSVEGQFWEHVDQFCMRVQAHSRDEILLGKPYTEEGRTYFRMMDLIRHLKEKKFLDYSVQQITKVMRMRTLDGEPYTTQTKWHLANGSKFVNLWSVPQITRANKFEVPEALTKDERAF